MIRAGRNDDKSLHGGSSKILYFAIINSCTWFIVGIILFPMVRQINSSIIEFWRELLWRF